VRGIFLTIGATALIGSLSACGSSPAAPSNPIAGSTVGFRLWLEPTSTAVTFQATLEGTTFTTRGITSLQLAPGTYTLTGTFKPPGLMGTEGLFITFQSDPGSVGGVRAGSLVKVSWPFGAVANCNAAAHTNGTPTAAAQSFTLQFEVIGSASGACP
jgi:hypothetical protein